MRVRRVEIIKYLLSQLANLVVLVVLASLGWWRHHSQWKLPKFSQIFERSSAS